MSELRKEMSSIRPELERTWAVRQISQQKEKQDEMARTIMVQVGTLLNARLAALEDRLLPAKPRLAADKRRQAAVARIEAERPPVTTLAAPSNSGLAQIQGTKKGKASSVASHPGRYKRRLEYRGAQGQKEGASSSHTKVYSEKEGEVSS